MILDAEIDTFIYEIDFYYSTKELIVTFARRNFLKLYSLIHVIITNHG